MTVAAAAAGCDPARIKKAAWLAGLTVFICNKARTTRLWGDRRSGPRGGPVETKGVPSTCRGAASSRCCSLCVQSFFMSSSNPGRSSTWTQCPALGSTWSFNDVGCLSCSA
jgi:hypothetical protein